MESLQNRWIILWMQPIAGDINYPNFWPRYGFSIL
jgi:hypothetical protein